MLLKSFCFARPISKLSLVQMRSLSFRFFLKQFLICPLYVELILIIRLLFVSLKLTEKERHADQLLSSRHYPTMPLLE